MKFVSGCITDIWRLSRLLTASLAPEDGTVSLQPPACVLGLTRTHSARRTPALLRFLSFRS